MRAGENEADQSALLMETLQKAPLSEMLLRRWERTLAKHGIGFTENEEAADRLELFLDMWDSSPLENTRQSAR